MARSGSAVITAALLALTAACTSAPDPVGTPGPTPAVTGIEVPGAGPTWSSSEVFGRLRAIPADDSSLTMVLLTDPVVLAAAASRDVSGRGAELGEFGWTTLTQSSSLCEAPISRYGVQNLTEIAPVQRRIDVWGEDAGTDTISVCHGGWTADPRPDDNTETIAGVDGTLAGGTWLGVSGDHLFAIGEDVDRDLAARVVTGTETADNALADHPWVTAVLAHVDSAPSVLMGTGLADLDLGRDSDLDPPADAQFSAYAWTPSSSGPDGTGLFVTLYDDPEDARAVGAWLDELWQSAEAPDGLTDAVTEVDGTAVLTSVPELPGDRFTLATLRYAQYPAFH